MSRRNNEDHIETKTNPLTEEVNDVKTEDPVLTENADDTAASADSAENAPADSTEGTEQTADSASADASEGTEQTADSASADASEGTEQTAEDAFADSLDGALKVAGNAITDATGITDDQLKAAGNALTDATGITEDQLKAAGNAIVDTTGITGDQLKALTDNMEALKESVEELKNSTVKPPRRRPVRRKSDEIAISEEEKRKREESASKRRSAEIMAVFAKHNFYANGLSPEELRITLEDLGPTYVKIGQIMSSRVDLLPESYCKELEKLRQNVQELDPRLARMVIEEQTGKTIDEIYSEFRDKPLGSASVGQAHYGVLKDGRKVVTKVRRPGIADMMRQDFVLLRKLAGIFSMVSEASDDNEDTVDLIEVIEEFEKVTEEELDFRTEAENTKFFRENCIEDHEKITCPEVVEELTTECMFTMSYVDGYSISKKDRVIEEGYDVNEIGRNIVENYVHQVLDVGTFHADPHQGNIMISHGKPVWIDFGMLGSLSDGDIGIIQSLVLSVIGNDAETLANAIMSLGASTAQTNRDRMMEDLDSFLDRYCNVSSINDLDISKLFEEISSLAAKHHVKMPGRFTMLIRSLATIEGVIEQFCPDMQLFQIISDKLMSRAKDNFDIQQELVSLGKDALEISKKASKIPALASDVLKGVARGRTKINLELTGYEELLNKSNETIQNIVLSVFACVVFFGSCIMCTADITPKAPGGIPAVAGFGLVFSVGLAIHAFTKLTKKK